MCLPGLNGGRLGRRSRGAQSTRTIRGRLKTILPVRQVKNIFIIASIETMSKISITALKVAWHTGSNEALKLGVDERLLAVAVVIVGIILNMWI